MIWLNILWPTFALVLLIFAVWTTMFVQRFRHLSAHPPTAADFATGASAMRYFEPVEMPANNFRNLFEAPVLYFALVPLLLITRQAWIAQIVLAWLFVILRAVHSYIHIGPKIVQARFRVYLASMAVLSAMWIGFAIDIARAEISYDRAVARIERQP